MNKYQNQKQTMRERKQAIKQWFFSTSCRVTLIALIVVCGLLFVVQISSVSTKGFEISDLEKSVQELERDNQKLEVQISEYRSMQSIQARLQDMDMIASADIEYIMPVGTAVARR